MVVPQVLPTWTDRDSCFRCHTSFSAFTRKHHCRACGETFCSTCSSKSSPLLEYGIEDEVRVCDSCYDRLTTNGSVNPATTTTATTTTTKPTEKSQAELDEEDALQLAISLSQSEAEEKERQKKLLTHQYAMSNIQFPPTPLGSAPIADQDDNEQKSVGGELGKYLDRNYWEGQTRKDLGTTTTTLNKDPSDIYVRDDEIDAFISSVNEHINNIKFRMLSNQQRGRNIANDTAVQSVFFMLQHMYPELHGFIKSLDDKQAYYESLQDKLSQLKDAREALNALREDHLENKKRQAYERDRQRQIQLAVKLDDMRQKKQAYLEYQRQLHLQRLAEQEAEMQARLDQQRRYAQQREQQNQMPSYVQPPSSVGYYQHPIHPSQLTSYSFSMGQMSDALPQSLPPPISQIQQPYSVHPSIQSNEQTLISFD
jgi:growth factor-regulated tyrosine kinase substrate